MKIDNYISVNAHGNKLLFRGVDGEGNHIKKIIDDFKPVLYLPVSKGGDSKGLRGESLKKYQFNNIAEHNQWYRSQKDIGLSVHGDIEPAVQFINTLPQTYTVTNNDLTILYYDIETEVTLNMKPSEMVYTAPEAITLISAYDTKTKKVLMFHYWDINYEEAKKFDDDIIKKYEIVHIKCLDEKDLLTRFLSYWVQLEPHIVTGWNTNGFDNPYIYNRITKILGKSNADKLSPFGVVRTREGMNSFGRPEFKVTFVGILHYDYLEVYSNYTFASVPNMRLDTIAELEVGANKLHHDGSFRDFYTNHKDKFYSYNARDTILVKEIDDEVDLISVAMQVAYECNCNLDDTFGSVKKADALMYRELKGINIVIPPKKMAITEPFPGGYVKEPLVGLHRATVSVDANSLYPHMIEEANIGMETQVPLDTLPEAIYEVAMQAKDNDMAFVNQTLDMSVLKGTPYTITPAGAVYDTSKPGVISRLMNKLYRLRKETKKQSLVHKQNYIDAKNELEKRGIVL